MRAPAKVQEWQLRSVRDCISVESIRIKRAGGEGMYRTVLEAFLERNGVKPQILLLECFCRHTEAKTNP